MDYKKEFDTMLQNLLYKAYLEGFDDGRNSVLEADDKDTSGSHKDDLPDMAEVFNMLNILCENTSEERRLKECPSCHGNDIGIKDNIEVMYPEGHPGCCIRSIWAYCRNCGYKTRKALIKVPDDNEDIEIRAGYLLWNKSV